MGYVVTKGYTKKERNVETAAGRTAIVPQQKQVLLPSLVR
jgi:hypothetical protein